MRRRRAYPETVADWVRLYVVCLLTTAFVAVGLSALGIVLSDATYAGASDERIQSAAVDHYATYLRSVGVAMLEVGALGSVAVSPITTGLAVLLGLRRRARASTGRLIVRSLLAASFASAVVWGFGAQRHPGLFLPALSSGRAVAFWAEACRYIAPVTVAVGLLGLMMTASRGRHTVQATLLVLCIALGVAVGRARSHYRTFRPTAFLTEAKAREKEKNKKAETKTANPAQERGLPSVVWIAVDSLRPDKIDPANTPHLAALVHESIYFPDTIVPVPRTGPSWAAALTSLGPLTNGIETMFPDASRANLSTVALPAHLVSNGYRTLVTSEYAGEFFGRVKLGFENESLPRAELREISGQMLVSRAPIVLAEAGLLYGASPWSRSMVPAPITELIRGMPNFSVPETLGIDVVSFLEKDPSPAFVLAFYSQPHFPYTSSPEFGRRYRVSGSSASLAYGRDVANEAPITTDADKKQLEALYRAALAETDAAVGKLLDDLKTRGRYSDTIVVLTADHGEGLYECSECVGHGDNLRGMMTLRVPFAIKLPKARYPEQTIAEHHETVSLLDVYPTLLSVLDLGKVQIHEGLALIEPKGAYIPPPVRTHVVETGEWLWNTAAVPKDRIEYPPITELAKLDRDRIVIDPKFEGVIRAAKYRAAIRVPYKLVYEPSRSGVRNRLFDIVADPLEQTDIAASHPEIVLELKASLRRDVLRHPSVLAVGDWFLTSPPGVPEKHW